MFHLLDAIYSRPWALHPSTLALMLQVAQRWSSGVRLSADEIQAAIGNAPEINARRESATLASSGGAVAVLPCYGILTARQYTVAGSSTPLTSAELLGKRVTAAAADGDVGVTVIDFDTPGGDAMGISEAGARIAEAAKIKPVIAVVNNQASSGGYWLASQCSEIVMAPDSMCGSIGVRTAHVDASAAYEQKGLKVEHIHAGKNKVDGADTGPLTDEARRHIQGMVDALYVSFTKAVAKGRNVPIDTVRGEAWGEGRVLLASAAVAAGMADRIDTLDNVIAKYSKARRGATARSEGMSGMAAMTGADAAIAIAALD